MTRAFVASTIVAVLLFACAAEQGGDSLNDRGGSAADPNAPAGGGTGDGHGTTGDPTQDGTGTVPGVTTAPDLCKGEPHVGFANFDFTSDRKAGEIGINRRRVKPYSALKSEFNRTLGVTPTNLTVSEAAYGLIPARWYIEPNEGAVAVYTTYNLAFTTCYDTMTAAKYTQMPDATSAATECAAMQRTIWQRTATPDETKACADFTLGLTDEPAARRRWAHACASIHAATGFTTY